MSLLALAVGGRGLVDPDEPVLHVDDEAFLRSRAAFETTRVYGGRPFKLVEHLARLAGSAERVEIGPIDTEELTRLAALAVEAAAAPDAMLRLFDSAEPNRPAYNLLCRYLAMLDDPTAERAPATETALSFRLKLSLAAGFAPALASCARCGEAEHLRGFSGAAGGVVCSSCEAGSFALSEQAHRFMVEAIASPNTKPNP